MAGDNFRYGVEQRLGVRPDVDVTAAMLLSEGNPCETSRFELDPSDVETPTPALCGSPVIVKPVAHAEPEELRNPVTLGLASRRTTRSASGRSRKRSGRSPKRVAGALGLIRRRRREFVSPARLRRFAKPRRPSSA